MRKIVGCPMQHIYYSTAGRNSGVNKNWTGQLNLQKAQGSFLITESQSTECFLHLLLKFQTSVLLHSYVKNMPPIP